MGALYEYVGVTTLPQPPPNLQYARTRGAFILTKTGKKNIKRVNTIQFVSGSFWFMNTNLYIYLI